FLIQLDKRRAALVRDQRVPVKQAGGVVGAPIFEAADLLAVQVEFDDVAIASRQGQDMAVIEHLVPTAAAAPHAGAPDDLSVVVELHYRLPVEGDNFAVGEPAGGGHRHDNLQRLPASAIDLQQPI